MNRNPDTCRRCSGGARLVVVIALGLMLGVGAAGAYWYAGGNPAADEAIDVALIEGAPIDSAIVKPEPPAEAASTEPDAGRAAAKALDRGGMDGIDLSAIPVATPVAAAPVLAEPEPQPEAAASPEPETAPGEYVKVGFKKLSSFKYVEPAPEEVSAAGRIPDEIMALSGQWISVTGFMIPTDIDDGSGVRTFILSKNQPLCCFGDMADMNEWIDVKMAGDKKAEFEADRPITVYGKLEVGEQIESGFVLSVYRMLADKVER